MKKNKFIKIWLTVCCFSMLAVSCSDENSGASVDFLGIATSYFEADGQQTLTVPFRNANSSISMDDIVIDGTATEGADADYTIGGVTEEGIQITLNDDNAAEVVETIRIRILGVDDGNVIHTVSTLSDDPGFLNVRLNWADPVDLDLISWYFDPEDEEWHDLDFSDPGNTLDPIDWKDPDGLYGFTYNYFAGSDDSVPFSVVFTPTGVTLDGGTEPLTFNATYTLANVDPNNVQIEQMVTKTGTAFTDFSDIEVPGTGSRKAELLSKLRTAAQRLAKTRGK